MNEGITDNTRCPKIRACESNLREIIVSCITPLYHGCPVYGMIKDSERHKKRYELEENNEEVRTIHISRDVKIQVDY